MNAHCLVVDLTIRGKFSAPFDLYSLGPRDNTFFKVSF